APASTPPPLPAPPGGRPVVVVVGGAASSVTVTGCEAGPTPLAFVAWTVTEYVLPLTRLRMVPDVAPAPKLARKLELLCDAVTVQVVIGDPPSDAGAAQVTFTLPSPAVAVTACGAPGVPDWSARWRVIASPGLTVTGSLGAPSSTENVNADGPNSSGAKCPPVSAMSSVAVAVASTPGASGTGSCATAE